MDDLINYIAVVVECEIHGAHTSTVKIVESKDAKVTEIIKKDVSDKIDLFNMEPHTLKIEYEKSEEVIIFLDDMNECVLKSQIRLRKLLEKGDSFTGIINAAHNMQSQSEIQSWIFVCYFI